MNIVKKIIDNTGDRNIVNIQLIPLNKEKQEVKRALKLWQSYLVRRILHFFEFVSYKNKVPLETGLYKNKGNGAQGIRLFSPKSLL